MRAGALSSHWARDSSDEAGWRQDSARKEGSNAEVSDGVAGKGDGSWAEGCKGDECCGGDCGGGEGNVNVVNAEDGGKCGEDRDGI